MPRRIKHSGFAGELFEEAPNLLKRASREKDKVVVENATMKKSGIRVVVNRGALNDEVTVQFRPGVFDFKRFSMALKRIMKEVPERSKFGQRIDRVTGIARRRAEEEKFLAEWGAKEYKKGYVKIAGKEYFIMFKHTLNGVKVELYMLNPLTKSPRVFTASTPQVLELNYEERGITSATFWKPYKDETAHLMKLVLNAEVIKQQ